MHFHNLTYSVSTTYYKFYILRYHKWKEIDQSINDLIYTYHKHFIQPTRRLFKCSNRSANEIIDDFEKGT